MVELFITDIDGCLAVPFRPFRVDRIAELRSFVDQAQSGLDGRYPKVSICSGRAYAYVEAMTQLLGIEQPVLFESAGGMIHPDTMRFDWHPDFSQEVDRQVSTIRDWFASVIGDSGLWIDAAKRTQAGLAGPTEAVYSMLSEVTERIGSDYGDFLVAHTPISIDVIPASLTKDAGIRWLSRELGIPTENMAYIGDANGDIEALKLVGHSFAPANAAPDVKDSVQTVTAGSDIDGVLEAYRSVLRRNGAI